jgi:hypothetical protein
MTMIPPNANSVRSTDIALSPARTLRLINYPKTPRNLTIDIRARGPVYHENKYHLQAEPEPSVQESVPCVGFVTVSIYEILSFI